MSLEQATLNYVHYCDSLMLINALNLILNQWSPVSKYKLDYPVYFIRPANSRDPEKTTHSAGYVD